MNYLVLRNDGIGDLIVSTCGINQLRKVDKKAHITLICSNRNKEYAKILKKDGHIDRLYNLDNVNTFSQALKFISILRKIYFEHIFILKSDWKNLIISLFCKSKNIHAINPTKIGKMSKKIIYKYPLFLSNKIFESIEIINSINIQDVDTKTKMGTHYRELFNKALNMKKTKLEYIKPHSVNKFANQIKKIFTPLRIKKQNTVLFHLDEKWSDINISKNLLQEGAKLCFYDPKVNSKEIFSEFDKISNDKNVSVCDSTLKAAEGSDAIIVLTDWDEFKYLDWQNIFEVMRKPAWIFDSRVFLDKQYLENIGFKVWSLGS